MSILIKGVTMPKNCFDCPMAFAVDFGILCTPTHYIVGDNEISKKQGFCPLIPVPQHGRLIDADALAHDLDDDVENDQRVLDEMDFVGKERERVEFDRDCKQNCLWYLSNAPTIIPADVPENNVGNIPAEEGE